MNELYRYIFEELKVKLRNLNKDNKDRKLDLDATDRQILKINTIKREFNELNSKLVNSNLDKDTVKSINAYIDAIRKLFVDIDKILKNRLELGVSSHQNLNLTDNMAESFCLKTAASLLPTMVDGNEDSIKQLIDSIELYKELLNDAGKKFLIQYVLKTKLSQNAKLRLEKTYNTNEELVTDIKSHLLTKHSPTVLSSELHNARQRHQSVEQFGKNIAELMTKLTIAQSDGDDEKAKILTSTNEKVAISSFCNGVNDKDLRIILKSRNYSKLKDAVAGAKDEEVMQGPTTSTVFYSRGSQPHRGNFRNSYNTMSRNNYNNMSRNNFRNNNSNRSFRGNNFNRNFRGNSNANFRGNNYRSQNCTRTNSNSRPFNNNVQRGGSNRQQRVYHTEHNTDNETEARSMNDNRFFRSYE